MNRSKTIPNANPSSYRKLSIARQRNSTSKSRSIPEHHLEFETSSHRDIHFALLPDPNDSEANKPLYLSILASHYSHVERVHFSLDKADGPPYNLNMFKQTNTRHSGQATRSHILTTALDIFRRRGLDSATMRDIAKSANVALGAAYYYFPSKEAIVLAYYDQVQAEHLARVTTALSAEKHDLLERLKIAFHTKIVILQGDRKLLGTLFRYTGEPEHPLSVFAPGTASNRAQGIAVFNQAIGDERLPDDIRSILPAALWALHFAVLLYFIYDDSPQQQRTHKLVDGILQLVVTLLSLVKSPLLKPFRGSLFALLRDAGLFSEPQYPAPLSQQEA